MAEHHKTVKHFDLPGDAHFYTFSCFNQLPLLGKDRTRRWFVEISLGHCSLECTVFRGTLVQTSSTSDMKAMTQHDDAIEKLTLMVNDTESLSLFRHNGPLAWFSPDATFSGATSRSALSDKQCKLIVDVFAQYLHFKSTSARFLKTIECSELTLKLQQLQKAKPKCETSNLKSISQRLATVVQALFGRWTFHIGHLDEAEKIVGELPLEGRLSVWQMVQGARLAYLCQLYESSST